MTKTFQRYIARGFWGPFFGSLSVFTAMLVLGNLFGKLYVFTKGEVSAMVFFKYVIYQVPYFMVKIMPVATLLAVLMALGKIVSTGEWKAGMAGGWRPFDMTLPLIICSVFSGLFQFSVQETIAPYLFLESEHIFRRDIRSRDDWARLVVNNVSFSLGKDRFITCTSFDGRINTLFRPMMSEYKDGSLKTALQSETAEWDGEAGAWIFRDAVETTYAGAGKSFPSVKKYEVRKIEAEVGPENLVLENLVPDGINLAGIRDRIRKMSMAGAPSITEHTLFWCKVSAPFANIIMALIGAGMALLFTGNKRFYSYGAAIGAGFLFWATLVFSQEIGTAKIMPPAIAGISPLILFGIISILILRKTRIF